MVIGITGTGQGQAGLTLVGHASLDLPLVTAALPQLLVKTRVDRQKDWKEEREKEGPKGRKEDRIVCWLVGCLTSQQQAGVSQGRICSDNFTCCHTEIEVADQTFYLTQSQYTDTGPTTPSADPRTPGAWQGSPWSANV